jgi:hypothetical protein
VGRYSKSVSGVAQLFAQVSSGAVYALTPAPRIVASGTLAIPANTSTSVGPFTRSAGERLFAALFVTEDVASAIWVEDSAAAGDVVQYFFQRTAIADQLVLSLINNNLLVARTVDWAVLGVVP